MPTGITHVKHEDAGTEGGDGDEGDVSDNVRQLALDPSSPLGSKERPIYSHHEALSVYKRHVFLLNPALLNSRRSEAAASGTKRVKASGIQSSDR